MEGELKDLIHDEIIRTFIAPNINLKGSLDSAGPMFDQPYGRLMKMAGSAPSASDRSVLPWQTKRLTNMLDVSFMLRLHSEKELSSPPPLVPPGLSPSPSPDIEPVSANMSAQPQLLSIAPTIDDEVLAACTDYQTSVKLQAKLAAKNPYAIAAIERRAPALMKHKFGNFVVQKWIDVADDNAIMRFTSVINGSLIDLATDEFCCHVMQRLLDRSPVEFRNRLATELLRDPIQTMRNIYGAHVWYKLLQVGGGADEELAEQVHEAVMRWAGTTGGWMAVAQSSAGCNVIRAFLCGAQGRNNMFAIGLDDARNECARQLNRHLDMLCPSPQAAPLILRLAMLPMFRKEVMDHICANAGVYAKTAGAYTLLLSILLSKIPGAGIRLARAISARPPPRDAHEKVAELLYTVDELLASSPAAKRRRVRGKVGKTGSADQKHTS